MTYDVRKPVKLSEHFESNEFKCKCGKCTTFTLNEKLVKMLETLYHVFNCSKIIVNSGYRCPEHDKRVGGSGKGQHIEGNAADVVLYDNMGKRIPSKYVCVAAQEIGFSGIAKINDFAVHLDVRPTGKYMGDETKSNNTVTSDFREYFGLTSVSTSVDGVPVFIAVTNRKE